MAGLRAFPGEAVYNASKFGMLGFTRALDHELREQGVRVTNIAPGGIATDFAMGSGRTPDSVEGMMSRRGRRRRGAVHGQPAAQPADDDRVVPADERGVVGLRLGLLSTAHINEKLVAGARLVDEVEVVAVASRDPGRGRASRRRRWSVPRALGSYEELLSDPDVDAVYISLPNSMHVDWSVRALEAGKHVLCEKPLARSVEPVERAFDAADAAGRVLAEAFMWRHHPQAQRLVELLPRVGELRVVRAQFSFALDSLDPASNIRLSGELEGGALMDVGCYCVSAARLIAGEPVAVTGQAGASTRSTCASRGR